MNRLFIAIDGDDAGRHIGQAVLMDDVQMLHDMSKKITAGAEAAAQFVQSLGGQVISSGGDEMVAMLDSGNEDKIEGLKAAFEQASGLTVTVGMGRTLSQAGKALIAGKLTGKNKIQNYDDSVEDILVQAHEANVEGTADEEQAKMDDHYIADTMDQESSSEEGFESEEQMPEDDSMYEEDFQTEDHEPQEFTEEMSDEQPIDEQQPTEGAEEFDDEAHDMMQAPGSDEEMAIDGEQGFAPEEDFNTEMSEENPDQTSDFEQETPIEFEGDEVIDQASQDPEAEKAAGDEELPEIESEDPSADLSSELADDQGNEDIMQRIAQNLEMFKENKELLEQIKDQNPELYDSMLALLQDLIDLAKMISGEEPGQEEAPQEDMEAPPQEQPEMAPPMENPAAPKM